MSDLKESGGLEQDSDYIMLLHRPYVNSKDEKENSCIRLGPYGAFVNCDTTDKCYG